MSFSELLKKARAEAEEITKIQKSHIIKTESTSPQTNINTPKVKEDKTETNLETSTDKTIGQALMIFAQNGLNASRKLRSTNKCKRLAKNFISGQCTPDHLIKAKKHIEGLRSTKHLDFKLCGGWATIQFFEHIEKGLDANQALNKTYKGPEQHEKEIR